MSDQRVPSYLISTDECVRLECGNDCQHVAKQDSETSRWFITMGHAGYNSPANNRSGYATKGAALAARDRYVAKARDRVMKSLPKVGQRVVFAVEVGYPDTLAQRGEKGTVTQSGYDYLSVLADNGAEVVWTGRLVATQATWHIKALPE